MQGGRKAWAGFAGGTGFILPLHSATDPRFLSNSVAHLIDRCNQAPSRLVNPDPQKTNRL